MHSTIYDPDERKTSLTLLAVIPTVNCLYCNRTVTGSTVTGNTVTGSTVTGSIVTGNTVTGSTVTCSTVTCSTVTGSTVTGSGANLITTVFEMRKFNNSN
jgi:hypothetical protein